jgi:acyl carrier protein
MISKEIAMDIGLDHVTTLLVASFGVPAEEVTRDVTLAELDVDSLALVEFCLLVEKKFGVTVSEDEIHGEDTVQDVVTLIQSKNAPV